ncbi:oxidoreductase [Streptomyces badius]
MGGNARPEQSADFGALLDSTGARAAVICTPIPTRTTDLALTAASGASTSCWRSRPRRELGRVRPDGRRRTAGGHRLQVGFQSFGSHAVPAIQELVPRTGAIGTLAGDRRRRGLGPRRRLLRAGRPGPGQARIGSTDVVDGVLTNPLAHAVATALELADRGAAEDVLSVETELFRAHDIEADDTSCVRVTTTGGLPVTVAATLCAEQAGALVIVHERPGPDHLLVQAGPRPDPTCWPRPRRERPRPDRPPGEPGRPSGAGTPLLAPPERTGAFMRVVEAVRTAPEPVALPADAWETRYDAAPAEARGVRSTASTAWSPPGPNPSPSSRSWALPGPATAR